MASMFKLCKCGKKISISQNCCDECAKKYAKISNKNYDKFSRDKPATKFYHSKAWRNLRTKMMRVNPFCAKCGRKADVIDHIVPIKAGGKKLSTKNLQPLCHKCHNEKTLNDKMTYGL